MKIKVRRLKEIIEEELDLFKKLHEGCGYKRDEDEYDIDTEDVEEMESSEAPGTGAGVALGDLKKVLEKWEEGEYESDESRWQEYAKDIQGMIDQLDGEEEHDCDCDHEDHAPHDCDCEHSEKSHEEREGEEESPKPKKKSKPKEKKEKGEESSTPKKAGKSGGKNFPYESKKLEQMIYQKLITAFGEE